MKIENKQLKHEEINWDKKRFPFSLLAHDIYTPSNVGSLFRIADALGIEKIYLSGTSPVPPHAKIKKTSRSTEKFIPFEYQENPLDIIKHLKQEDYQILSLEITSSSIDIREFKMTKSDKICLIIGAESFGVSPELLLESDTTLHIPMHGENSSMNVATACSIAVFELIKHYK